MKRKITYALITAAGSLAAFFCWKNSNKGRIIQFEEMLASKEEQEMIDKMEPIAKDFVAAIKKIARKPDNLENLESYLTYHFPEWLEKYANTPEKITVEITEFADMEI